MNFRTPRKATNATPITVLFTLLSACGGPSIAHASADAAEEPASLVLRADRRPAFYVAVAAGRSQRSPLTDTAFALRPGDSRTCSNAMPARPNYSERRDDAYTFGLGWRFARNFAIEAGHQRYGETGTVIDHTLCGGSSAIYNWGRTIGRHKISATSLAIRGAWPLSERLDMSAAAGFAYTRQRSTYRYMATVYPYGTPGYNISYINDTYVTRTNSSLLVGLQLNYRLTRQIVPFAGWTYHEQTQAQSFALGLQYDFH